MNTRMGELSVKITPIHAEDGRRRLASLPSVTIEWQVHPDVRKRGKHNPEKAFRLVGRTDTAGALVNWYQTKGDLFTAAGSLDELVADGRLMSKRTDRNFILRPLAMTPGAAYTFRLTATDPATGMQGYAEFSTIVNSPPAAGTFNVLPTRGLSLQTPFLLNASMWNDEADDYPLKYGFRYVVDSFEVTLGPPLSCKGTPPLPLCKGTHPAFPRAKGHPLPL